MVLAEGQKNMPRWIKGKIPEGPRNRQRPLMGEDQEAKKAYTYPTVTTR